MVEVMVEVWAGWSRSSEAPSRVRVDLDHDLDHGFFPTRDGLEDSAASRLSPRCEVPSQWLVEVEFFSLPESAKQTPPLPSYTSASVLVELLAGVLLAVVLVAVVLVAVVLVGVVLVGVVLVGVVLVGVVLVGVVLVGVVLVGVVLVGVVL
ncbi:MAG: hypothetical protein VB080_08885, partial [Propionicimonas sp.]|uniref:hypothetical protein n=1 Tax=Propionicimonas sp. TaxID=1955623 RepID=UPI002B204FF2